MKKNTPPGTIDPTTRKLRLSRVVIRPLTITELESVEGGARPRKGSKVDDQEECQTV